MREGSARYRPPAMTAVIGGLTSELKCSGHAGQHALFASEAADLGRWMAATSTDRQGWASRSN